VTRAGTVLTAAAILAAPAPGREGASPDRSTKDRAAEAGWLLRVELVGGRAGPAAPRAFAAAIRRVRSCRNAVLVAHRFAATATLTPIDRGALLPPVLRGRATGRPSPVAFGPDRSAHVLLLCPFDFLPPRPPHVW